MVSFLEKPQEGHLITESSTGKRPSRFFQILNTDQPKSPPPIAISQGATVSNQPENAASPVAPASRATNGGSQQQLVAIKKAKALAK
jgi:hypothetical protein